MKVRIPHLLATAGMVGATLVAGAAPASAAAAIDCSTTNYALSNTARSIDGERVIPTWSAYFLNDGRPVTASMCLDIPDGATYRLEIMDLRTGGDAAVIIFTDDRAGDKTAEFTFEDVEVYRFFVTPLEGGSGDFTFGLTIS